MFASRFMSSLRHAAVLFRRGGRRLGSELRKTRLGGSWPVRLLFRVFRRLGWHDAAHMAAGVSYYAVLSLFPLVLALSAIIGLDSRPRVPGKTNWWISSSTISLAPNNSSGTPSKAPKGIVRPWERRRCWG